MTDARDRGDEANGATMMHVRTTVLLALAGASCTIPGTIGDLPGTSDSGAEGETGTTVGSSADGHSSQTAEDGDGDGDGTSETTFDPSDGGSGTTGDVVELCTHEPSGSEPGSVIGEWMLHGVVGHEVAVVNGRVWVVGKTIDAGEADDHTRILRFDGAKGQSSWTWEAPGNVQTNPRHIAAIGDRVFIGIDLPGTEHCAWCSERTLIAYDDNNFVPTDPVFTLPLGAGSWGMAATATGTLLVVGSTSDDGVQFAVTLSEFDLDGNLVRVVDDSKEISGDQLIVSHAFPGRTGDAMASGRYANDPNSGWVARWGQTLGFNWLLGGSSAFTIGRSPNGEYLNAYSNDATSSLQRGTADGGNVWQVDIDSLPSDIAIDCDDSIVAAGVVVERRDGDGSLQWSTPTDGIAKAVALGPEGNVYAIVSGDDSDVLVNYAGL
jgi:hypothetical protein